MGIPSKRQRSLLEATRKKAEKHNSGGRVRIWAMAVHRGSVVAEDGNDYLDQSASNKLPGMLPTQAPVLTLHAELAVIARLANRDRVPSGMTLYIAGFGRSEALANTRPCPICTAAIKKAGVFDKVVFLEDGEPVVLSVDQL